jgi:hypothetical protein
MKATQGSHAGFKATPSWHGLWAQVLPQSCGHDCAVSPASHTLLPHTGGHAPQSTLQVVQVSPPVHMPSPHCGVQGPQSWLQVEHVSPPAQEPLPQLSAHAPQSSGQLVQSSVASQNSSPQPAQVQSVAQVSQDSPASHVRLPQVPGFVVPPLDGLAPPPPSPPSSSVPKSSAVTPWAQPCTDSAPAIRTNSTQGNFRIGRSPSRRIRRQLQ